MTYQHPAGYRVELAAYPGEGAVQRVTSSPYFKPAVYTAIGAIAAIYLMRKLRPSRKSRR